MSKKAKYKAHPDAMNPGLWFVESPRDIICQRCTYTGARRIARALNAMEAKPKAKPFKFDWKGIPKKYKFAAMDLDGEWAAYEQAPRRVLKYWDNDGNNCMELSTTQPPYPGDWRDSLQKRP